MNTFIYIFIGLANIIAILLVYYSFGKNTEKQKKFMNTMIAIGMVYIVTIVVYYLSSIGITKYDNTATIKDMLILAFVPVNAIIHIPYVINSIMKYKNKKITMQQLNTRVITIFVIALIILTGEFFYFRSLQKDMVVLIEDQLQNSVNELKENNTENLETIEENAVQNLTNTEENIVNAINNIKRENSINTLANNVVE